MEVYFNRVLGIAVYGVLCCVYLRYGVHNQNWLLKAALKCAPLIGLFVAIWYNMNMRGQLLWGLAFSILGDGFLVYRSSVTGLLGVSSFSISVCTYSVMLGFNFANFVSLDGQLLGVCIALLSFILYDEMRRSLDLTTSGPVVTLVVTVFGPCYLTLISIMLWSGSLSALREVDMSSALGALGSVMFYVSDLSIAASAIWPHFNLFKGRILVMTTYYCAQLLLVLCVIYQSDDDTVLSQDLTLD